MKDDHYTVETENEMKACLKQKLDLIIPTHFLTIALFKPYSGANYWRLEQNRQSDIKQMHKEVINRFDRCLYGKHHKKLDESEKFPYVFRIETKDKKNRTVPPHIHCLMELDQVNTDILLAKQIKLLDSLKKLCLKLGFRDDIDFRKHSIAKSDYIIKYPMADIENIHFRLPS